MKAKPVKSKKVIKHLKGDIKGYHEEIDEDKELIKELKKSKKISPSVKSTKKITNNSKKRKK